MTWSLTSPMYPHHLWKVSFGTWNQRVVTMPHCYHFSPCLTSFDQCCVTIF
ncbi:unnamed protein product [Acanthoscelides obtectus]|uniref:Uncharacterized protein n=1 Tax=Acanthoscelides obtectus TaxID=200917 RepID=A0A9P0PPD2_ACAOB|nr:unnamed protein product [Acanthoscelides obtectus]CAK1669806.1 hypothetical protein AOBTE_LOCUS27260 [Acanthoscelides obtectus]